MVKLLRGRAAPLPSGSARSGYLRTLTRVLWPGEAAAVEPRRPHGRPARVEYLVIPDARHPRLLVPAGNRTAAAAAVRHFRRRETVAGRFAVRALAAGLRTGAVPVLLPHRVRVRPCSREEPAGTPEAPEAIEDHLRRVLGDDLVLGIQLGGPARANRKPVLQVAGRTGEPVAFVKIGVDELTRRLVRNERLALDSLRAAGLRDVQVPEVLHAGAWGEQEILVQSVLPTWRRPAPYDPGRLARAMREIASVGGIRTEELAGSGYWTGLAGRVDGLAGRPEAADVLRTACARVAGRWSGLRLPFGAWHGDWSGWNMAFRPDRLLVWDWERFTRPVPVGFDAVHHRFQGLAAAGRLQPGAAVDATLAAAADILRPWAFDAERAQAVALLYLLDIATRYAADGQDETGARLGDLWTRLPAVLDDRLSRSTGGRSGEVTA
ncbi:MAG: hypothetical protein ACJ73E_03500 [Mycobacteriales bacterium]